MSAWTVTDFRAGLADQLLRAERDRIAISPLTAQGRVSPEDAYAIQAINTQRRTAAGEVIVGRKVGLTSLAMQEQLGVDEPDFGVVFERMLIPNGGTLFLDELIAPRVEAEIGFRLARDLGGPDVTDQQARAAVSGVFLALEVIDSRIADWKITLADTIADNASSARMIAGPSRDHPDDLPAVTVSLDVDGKRVAGGVGDAVLGDPIRALTWLARRLDGFGETLRADDLILAGAVHASVALTGGTRVTASAPGFAPVQLTVA
ncbi:2-keto-4-pentenoate hydratase [Actinoplanes sp. CA-131856]